MSSFCLTGILEPEEEEVEDDPNDEILTELKQAQANLKPLLQWKNRHLRDLLKKACLLYTSPSPRDSA